MNQRSIQVRSGLKTSDTDLPTKEQADRDGQTFKIHDTLPAAQESPFEIKSELYRLDDKLTLYDTSVGIPLLAPATLEKQPNDWPEARALCELSLTAESKPDTILVSAEIKNSENQALESNKLHVGFTYLKDAISASFKYLGIHDYDDVKASILANSRRSNPEILFDAVVLLGVAPSADKPTELDSTGSSDILFSVESIYF